MLECLKKAGFADDGAYGGSLHDLWVAWKDLQKIGPPLGFFPNASKTWLIVKEPFREEAQRLFSDINFTCEGRKYLRSFIGKKEATDLYVAEQF